MEILGCSNTMKKCNIANSCGRCIVGVKNYLATSLFCAISLDDSYHVWFPGYFDRSKEGTHTCVEEGSSADNLSADRWPASPAWASPALVGARGGIREAPWRWRCSPRCPRTRRELDLLREECSAEARCLPQSSLAPVTRKHSELATRWHRHSTQPEPHELTLILQGYLLWSYNDQLKIPPHVFLTIYQFVGKSIRITIIKFWQE